ncbi:chemotaxis protein CheW [Lentibacillus sp. N15]|uniref:chemotaxis protein CheW n=1 Tax=Lentibacillus songyuanensis TaxID=3136161 RepID=UPI0031BA2BD9
MEEIEKFIVFVLNDQAYGVDVKQVLSIERMPMITEVPKTPDFIKGIAHLRGETTPIIDLKERLHITETKQTADNHVLVVHIDERLPVGLIVDAANEVITIPATVIEPAPRLIGGVDQAFLKGIAKLDEKLLILLDLERILDIHEVREIQEAIKK